MPRSLEELRPLARQMLNRHDIRRPPVPIDRIAQGLGMEIRYSPVEGDVAGMVFRQGNHAIIGVNSVHHPNRQRFTIAHEIGHFLLHKGMEVHIDHNFSVRVNLRNPESQLGRNDDEIEANRFAAELLMPYDMLIDQIQSVDVEDENEILRLAQTYEVSLQAMTIRVSDIAKQAI